ncbi:MAG: methyltransferase domain-containing protein [Candidatus Cloacimonetes bacterium]|nr:methyltransferase domain-containing protein [Candidatus Cloacimonadota bacterium]
MKDTKQFFDEYADDFDALYGVPKNFFNQIINLIFRKSMKQRFNKTIKYAQPIINKTVLDIGCGPGYYAVALSHNGAEKVVGIDFSEEMINIAKQKARLANVSQKCEFIVSDITDFHSDTKFNYSILMGFMDYISKPGELISKVISLTEDKIFVSFPADGGILAAQRKIRYRSKCSLHLYKENDLIDIFSDFKPFNYKIEKISRDFFVTLSLKE